MIIVATYDPSGDDSSRYRNDYIVSTLVGGNWIEVITPSINFSKTTFHPNIFDASLGLGLGIELIRQVLLFFFGRKAYDL